MFRRVDVVDPTTENGQRAASVFQACLVRHCIHTARQATHHRDTIARHGPGQIFGHLPAISRDTPRAHDRYRPFVIFAHFAARVKHRRRLFDFFQQAGIAGIFPGKHLNPLGLDLPPGALQKIAGVDPQESFDNPLAQSGLP